MAKSKRRQQHIPSHFKVAEVTMRPLNDPPPPSSSTANTVQYYDINLIDRQTYSRTGSLSKASEKQDEITYPSVSHETRRLLQEVANVRRQYEQKTVDQMASELPRDSELDAPSFKSNKRKKVRKTAHYVENTVMENSVKTNEDVPSLSHSKVTKKRFVAHVDSISFGLSPEKPSRQRPTTATQIEIDDEPKGKKEGEENIDAKGDVVAGQECDLVSPGPNAVAKNDESIFKPWRANMRRSSSEVSKEPDKVPEKKTEEEKPWRANMRKSPSKESEETFVVEEEENEPKAEDRPWRANMKKSPSKAESEVSATEGPCHSRQRPPNHEKVKKYMQDKRKKSVVERKAREEATKTEKARVQERLEALSEWRRKQSPSRSQESHQSMVRRLRKHEETDFLKNVLTQLTNEMRAKYQNSSIPQRPPPALESSKEEEGLIKEVKAAVTESPSNHDIVLRAQLEKFRQKQKEVLQEIQSSHPDLMAPTTTQAKSPAKEPPDVIMPYLAYQENPVNLKEPPISLKEPPLKYKEPIIKPDAFNVMSTAERKFWRAKENDLPVLSEGPLSTTEAEIEEDNTLSSSKSVKTSGSSTSSQKKSHVSNDVKEEVERPVRDVKTDVEKRVPAALHLRFQAELQQMESIQEAERQLNHINQIRNVVSARNEAATQAQALSLHHHREVRGQEKTEKSSSSRETRSQFESRMRAELQELFNSRMAELMKTQIEATKMTVEAANQLANIQQKSKTTTTTTRSSLRISEDIKTMISKTESSVPEILSVVEATDRSAKDIQKSIKSAIRQLSNEEDPPSSNNITEEIAAELTEDDLRTISSVEEPSMNSNFVVRHLEEQRRRDKQQYSQIKKRQKVLAENTRSALAKLEAQKGAALKSKDEAKYERIMAKEKKVRKHYREQKDELYGLRYALQVADRERGLLWRQKRKMNSTTTEDDTISSSTISLHHEEDSLSSKPPPPKKSAAPIKTPLSPKRTHLRRRHSSADSEDSFSMMSQVETVSSAGDQSDLEIRVHALQEELNRRMKTAAKLKNEKEKARRERLKVQEDALKKQIEVYDQLIEQTKADIDAQSPSPPPSSSSASKKIVQPQIKTPKQQSLKAESSTETPPPSISQQSSVDEASSTETIVVSPHKIPTTPTEDEKPRTPAPADLNYSDDFTSSSITEALAPPQSATPPLPSTPPAKKKLTEKTVDAICGHLLEAMIDDAVGRMKNKATVTTNQEPISSPRARTSPPHMQTAFDISSESSEEESSKEPSLHKEIIEPIVEDEPNEEGDFIDDDFGLSIKREWEHLKQQQMRIEEEINNIQKEVVPAEKPPPPYIPPESPVAVTPEVPKSPRRPPPPKVDTPCYVPSSKNEVVAVVEEVTQKLFSHGDDLTFSEDEFQALCRKQGQNEESYRTFLRFLVDLIQTVMADIYSGAKEQQNPPWMSQKPLVKRIQSIPSQKQDLVKRVTKEVLVAFNYEKRAQKENLIVRWSHKRRDRVDQVLVRELHAEEASWTNYEEDEVEVKDEIANVMMEALLADTVQAFTKIIRHKG